MEEFADFLHLLPNKLSIRHEIDFALCDDEDNVVAYAEVKCRNVNMKAYKTFFIAATKYKQALDFTTVFKKPVYFIVKWNDFIGYWEVKDLDSTEITWNGNKKRNDGQGDIEPVLHIPVSEFVIFK